MIGLEDEVLGSYNIVNNDRWVALSISHGKFIRVEYAKERSQGIPFFLALKIISKVLFFFSDKKTLLES